MQFHFTFLRRNSHEHTKDTSTVSMYYNMKTDIPEGNLNIATRSVRKDEAKVEIPLSFHCALARIKRAEKAKGAATGGPRREEEKEKFIKTLPVSTGRASPWATKC